MSGTPPCNWGAGGGPCDQTVPICHGAVQCVVRPGAAVPCQRWWRRRLAQSWACDLTGPSCAQARWEPGSPFAWRNAQAERVQDWPSLCLTRCAPAHGPPGAAVPCQRWWRRRLAQSRPTRRRHRCEPAKPRFQRAKPTNQRLPAALDAPDLASSQA